IILRGTFAARSASSTVEANLFETQTGSVVNLGDDALVYGSLYFNLVGAGAKVNIKGGEWTFDVKSGTDNDMVIVQGGGVEIVDGNTATLRVRENAVVPAGTFFWLFSATQPITGNFATEVSNVFAGGGYDIIRAVPTLFGVRKQ